MRCELMAEPTEGDSLKWMQATARKTGSHLSGSLMIQEGNRFVNRLFLVAPDGNYNYYDKRHLFRMGEEHLHFSPGNERVVARIGHWKVMLLICYDLRFPVWLMNTYKEGNYDYDAIVIVANWPAARSRVWRSLLLARAIDNQCFVIGVNRTGIDGNGLAHCGDSVVVSPRGEILADCEQNESASVITSLSKEALDTFRHQFKVALDWDTFEIII
jgi:predicted amidohydrolase